MSETGRGETKGDGPPVRQRLEERARKLAQRHDDGSGRLLEAVAFRDGQRTYAIPTGDVAEIAPGAPVARVPGTPPRMVGMMRLRGELLAVVALTTDRDVAAAIPWVIVLAADRTLGIIADEVTLAELDPATLVTPPPATEDSGDGLALQALTPDHRALLDVPALLRSPQLWPFQDRTGQP